MGHGRGASSANREGRRIARLFRQYRNLGEHRACDLTAILAEDDANLPGPALAEKDRREGVDGDQSAAQPRIGAA